MNKSLGIFRSARPLGLDYSRSSATLVTASPRANLLQITTNQRPGRIESNTVTPANLSINGVELIGAVPNVDDDGFFGTYDVSQYTIFYFPNKLGSRSDAYNNEMRIKRTRKPRQGQYRVFFVNGMQGNPEKFKVQACATAAVSGGKVTGVFNASGGFATDVWQCATDKGFSNDWLNLKVEAWKLFGSPSQSKIDQYVLRQLKESNLASASLYQQLLEALDGECRVVAHSQGNIIVCNAVNGIYAARGKSGVSKIKIYAVASPVVFWSNAKPCVVQPELNFNNDLVSWLGANWGKEAYLSGWSAGNDVPELKNAEVTLDYKRPALQLSTHQFYIYLEKYWELLKGRFN